MLIHSMLAFMNINYRLDWKVFFCSSKRRIAYLARPHSHLALYRYMKIRQYRYVKTEDELIKESNLLYVYS